MHSTRPSWRGLELALALTLGLTTLPLLVGTALVSALAYRTSPFFVHDRVGRYGRLFRVVKIRTLPPTTSPYADKHTLGSVRMPRSMQIVRRLHLDELPQLWLVLSGRMSLVGPRPEMAVLHRRIASGAAAERLSVRPGITGLWQVSVHSDGLICDRIEYDRLYVQHRSTRLDVWILLKTFEKMVLGRRFHLFDVPRWAIARIPDPPAATPATTVRPVLVGSNAEPSPVAAEPALVTSS